MNIEELGLMTFPRASERWNKERSYVYQQYKKYPEKFLPGSTDFLSGGADKGTWVITRKGMEYLTGQTEIEAAGELWKVFVLDGTNIIEEKSVFTEQEALETLFQIVELKGYAKFDFDFLDPKKSNYGTKLPDNTTVYFKNIRRGIMPDEMSSKDFTAIRKGRKFVVIDAVKDEIANISLLGEIEYFYPDIPHEIKSVVESFSERITRYDRK